MIFISGRTPDSPESVRAVAPRSPISPKAQYTNLPLQRTTNGSTSPINIAQKGGSATPPHTSTASTPQAATPLLLTDTSKELSKLRKFLGALYQFGQDTNSECGDRVRSLILSLVVSFTFVHCRNLNRIIFGMLLLTKMNRNIYSICFGQHITWSHSLSKSLNSDIGSKIFFVIFFTWKYLAFFLVKKMQGKYLNLRNSIANIFIFRFAQNTFFSFIFERSEE